MPSYRVQWEIDLDAETPEEAAILAYNLQASLDTTATVYAVYSEDGKPLGQIDVFDIAK